MLHQLSVVMFKTPLILHLRKIRKEKEEMRVEERGYLCKIFKGIQQTKSAY